VRRGQALPPPLRERLILSVTPIALTTAHHTGASPTSLRFSSRIASYTPGAKCHRGRLRLPAALTIPSQKATSNTVRERTRSSPKAKFLTVARSWSVPSCLVRAPGPISSAHPFEQVPKTNHESPCALQQLQKLLRPVYGMATETQSLTGRADPLLCIRQQQHAPR
jgi:hypothetical protein